MEISNIEKTRKHMFVFFISAFIIPLIVIFTIVDIIEGDVQEILVNILSGIVFLSCLFSIKKLNSDLFIYRLGLVLLSTCFLYNIYIGAGNGTALFWLFSFPPVFYFFLGRIEGTFLSLFFYLSVIFLLINPFSFSIFKYDIGTGLRFLASFLLVTIISYGLETSREKYGLLLMENQAKLLREKKNLDAAIKEIKTLSGLIPICSNCKKIRNDEGFWQQVEVYIRDHSQAEFTHGICPECLRMLYPGCKK